MTNIYIYLSEKDEKLAKLIARVNPKLLLPPLPEERSLFYSLLTFIAHQQLHNKAAHAILSRLKEYFKGDYPTAPEILETKPEIFRNFGFSQSKYLSLISLTEAELSGFIPSYTKAQILSDEEIIEILIKIKGIGRWTAEMLLIFLMGREDVVSVGDFGIREGYKILYAHEKQLSPKKLSEQLKIFKPYRTYVGLYLWYLADEQKKLKKG